MPLDSDDIARELREHRSLIPRACPDLEHVMRRLNLEELGHAGDHEWLGNRLSLRDSQRVIPIGDVLIFYTDGELARDFCHCGEHAFVPDAHSAQIADHLIAVGLKIHRTNCVPNSKAIESAAAAPGAPAGWGPGRRPGGPPPRKEGFGAAAGAPLRRAFLDGHTDE